MHRYRSHTCGALRESDIGQETRLSGWCHRIRDHGGVLFIDLRDHYGLTQVVADPDSPAFKTAETLRAEWVVKIDGKVRARPAGTENAEMPTGKVEVYITAIEVLGPAGELPMPVFGDQEYPEETRLKYRFLDLRREKLHANIMTRTKVIASMRRRMEEAGFADAVHAEPSFQFKNGAAFAWRISRASPTTSPPMVRWSPSSWTPSTAPENLPPAAPTSA